MKKHLSLMLVFLLLLGMTAFASVPADPAQTATKLYYKQDFNYANFDVFAADVYYNDLTVKTATATAADVAGARTAGLNMMTKKSNFSNAKWSISNKNSNGNNMLEGINSLGDTGFSFITDESWVANANEKYIISFELTSNYLPWGGESRTHYNIHVIGNNGTAETQKYQTGVICQMTGGGTAGILTNTSGSSNWDTQTFVLGTPKRLVYVFEQNGNGLKRSVLADGASWHNCSKYLENMKSVDGFNYLICANFPAISNIRMYTVNNNVDFAASLVDGETVSPVTEKITLKFNHPVYRGSISDSDFTMKKGTEPFTKFTVGDIKTVDNGTEIYSTVDINFISSLDDGTPYSVVFSSNIKDELGNTAEPVTFTTGDYPTFDVTDYTVSGMESGDDLDVLENKNTTFNAAFKNTSSDSAKIIFFVGIYKVGTDGLKDTADDKLVGYSLAKSIFAAGSTQNIKFGTKIEESDMYVKMLSFGYLEDLAAGTYFSENVVD